MSSSWLLGVFSPCGGVPGAVCCASCLVDYTVLRAYEKVLDAKDEQILKLQQQNAALEDDRLRHASKVYSVYQTIFHFAGEVAAGFLLHLHTLRGRGHLRVCTVAPHHRRPCTVVFAAGTRALAFAHGVGRVQCLTWLARHKMCAMSDLACTGTPCGVCRRWNKIMSTSCSRQNCPSCALHATAPSRQATRMRQGPAQQPQRRRRRWLPSRKRTQRCVLSATKHPGPLRRTRPAEQRCAAAAPSLANRTANYTRTY